ncbi:ATP-binding protein [Cupriavidus sp. 2TAF22]|uniref:ATP-binding protein n=1 Tax=unclassified Cupriavidus TaxID=2640874 RepID=UPI003F913D4A
MTSWEFYGRMRTLETLDRIVHGPNWFFCRIQGRRRIGKTTLLRELSKSEPSLLARMVYMQIPDSDERDVAAGFRRALEDCESEIANALAPQVTDFASMAGVIGLLCRRGLIVVLDEFQYFTEGRLYAFNSFLQEQVDRLRDTQGGGLFVLGSLQSEMSALLDDKGAPLFGRLTATIDLQHWDFEDLIEVYRAHDIRDPHHWLTLWGFFEGVPKFYRDAYDQGLFQVDARFQEALLERMFLREGSPLAEEADTSFLREVKGRLLSVLNFLSEHPGSSHGQLVGTLLRDEDEASLKVTIKRLVENYHMVDKRHPVFSESKSRNSRYYITDNFLQVWLSVVKPARDASRMRPLSKAIDLTLPRLHGHEGYAFEKLIRQLHVECSRKGVGDFSLTSIELGYWNRPRDEQNAIEIDIVALDEDARRIRFGSCKRSASKHTLSSLSEFEQQIERFMSTKEGRRVKGWTSTKALFSPAFSDEEARALTAAGYQCLDLPAYVRMLTSPRSV